MEQEAPVPPLLLAAQQLGVGWWAHYVLPLLVGHKSAAAATLSCKQLRKLCQGGQQALQLDGSALQETAAVPRIPAHFPACRKLTVVPRSSDDLAFHLPDALDALTGMTSLFTLTVDVLDAAGTADPCAMVLALQGGRRLLAAAQLAQAAPPAAAAEAAAAAAAAAVSKAVMGPPFALQLTLHKPTDIEGQWHAHPRVWQAIGQLPGLGSLQISVASTGVRSSAAHLLSVDVLMPPSSMAHVSALANLASTLHTLLVEPSLDQQQNSQTADYSALGSLSRLTCLGLPLAAERQGLSSVRSCCQLRELSLLFKGAAGAAQHVTLQPSELDAFSQLTQLTRLSLNSTAYEDSAGWSFLSSLWQLRELVVGPRLPYTVVATLEHLTCLTALTCGWEQEEGLPQTTSRCAAVRELAVLEGATPLWAFPGLTTLIQCVPWDPAVLPSAAEFCTQLNSLQMLLGGSDVCQVGSLRDSAPAAERMAGVGSLAALQHFTHLDSGE
ncbi:hypothetical protein OEZ86_001543 [Tetradesmus obliquus]|nr:hypothetical protein OEZ86_001543 [Tetradesmus obliquus]